MPLLSGQTQLKNTVMGVMLLPEVNRVPQRFPAFISVTLAAAVTVGAVTASLTASAANTAIKAGTALSFLDSGTRKQIIIIDDVTLGTTAVSANVLPATDPIATASVARTLAGLVPLYGMQSFGISSSDQDVDTTDTLSGFGTQVALVRSGKSVDISAIQIPSDPGIELIKRVTLQGAFFGKEIYAVLTSPDGEMMRGAAIARNLQLPGTQNEIKRVSFQLSFQGNSFVHEPAYTV